MDTRYGDRESLYTIAPNIASIVQKFTPSIFLSLASELILYSEKEEKQKKKNLKYKKVSHNKAIYHWLFDIKLTLSKSKF